MAFSISLSVLMTANGHVSGNIGNAVIFFTCLSVFPLGRQSVFPFFWHIMYRNQYQFCYYTLAQYMESKRDLTHVFLSSNFISLKCPLHIASYAVRIGVSVMEL